MDISLGKYFAMLVAIIAIPFVYIVVTCIGYEPPPDHRILQDQTVAQILDMNASDVIFSGYSTRVQFFLISVYNIVLTESHDG
jgi:hypothetical protein